MLFRNLRRMKAITIACVGTAMIALSQPVSAGEVNTGYFGNVAIKGYDAVAYFTVGKAIEGSEAFAYKWLGADWHFASAAHRDVFAADPIAYAPQYGGHCSDGVAYGDRTVNIDPEAWRIINGKLYLNFDQGAAEEFAETPKLREEAERNWPGIRALLTKP